MSRTIKDFSFYLLTLFLTLTVVSVLYFIFRFIGVNGIPMIYDQLLGTTEKTVLSSKKLLPMITSTLLLTVTTLALTLPIAVSAAVYLHEYSGNNFIARTTRFCASTLASIPSIVYGLFGMLIFVRMIGFGISIIAGAATLTAMLIPLIITQTENALSQIPDSYREASASLGATRFETVSKVVIPNSLSGILVAILLSTGRIVSESAALLFTVGTFVRMPVNRASGLLSILESGTTLTIRALIEFREYGNVEAAAAIGVITIGVVIMMNLASRFVVWLLE